MTKGSGKTYAFFDTATNIKNTPLLAFPCKLLAGSALFWIVMITVSYISYLYISLLVIIYDETDLHRPCDKLNSDNSNRNIHRVMNYPLGDAVPYLKSFGLVESKLKSVTTAEQSLPFVVTAVQSSQFYQVQGLVRHINEQLSSVEDMNLVIYDLGLTEEENELLHNQCQCIVRRFRFEAYPLHVETFNFAWRPLIIQEVLKETGSVIYIEPTTRFKSAASLQLFRNPGTRQFYIWDMPMYTSVIGYTYPKMFDYFKEDRCAFMDSGMVSTEIMAFYNTNITWHSILKPWVACALNKDCISPDGARSGYCYHSRHPQTTGCHRFDQSALSIIVNRAYQITSERSKHIPPRIIYYDDREEIYFSDQPPPSLFWSVISCAVILLVLFCIFAKYRRLC